MTDRRDWTITKFERHPDGYFHARLTVSGKTIYVYDRFGSWMAPGTVGNKAVHKDVLFPYSEELADRRKKAIRAEGKEVTGEDAATGDTSTDAGDAVHGELVA